jgi:hypothetical protein
MGDLHVTIGEAGVGETIAKLVAWGDVVLDEVLVVNVNTFGKVG